MKHVRERIQINSEPISEDLFAIYFFKVWEKIAPGDQVDPNWRPRYFGFLTLLSFSIFLGEGVNEAIYETGVGGEFNTTNIIRQPVATGITMLGIDHDRVLRVPAERRPSYFTLEKKVGANIEEIAWHKAGIFKSGCPAFSVRQRLEAESVLRKRAEERGSPLTFVDVSPEIMTVDYPSKAHPVIATLAIFLVDIFMKSNAGRGIDLELIKDGLRTMQLPGRCQHLQDALHDWYLDGAHTEDSLANTARWYAESIKK
ncbi:MAG: hypothetical protein Q9222_004016 [Ikaeria aurantiellina]